MSLDCFKAYDIRGKVPSSLSPALVRAIGYAYAEEFNAKTVVIGHDARLSSPELYKSLAVGLQASGVNVVGIGLCGTEEIYHATAFCDYEGVPFDGGIMVTGSHNPADENGLKMVRSNAIPISADTGLLSLKARLEQNEDVPDFLVGEFVSKSFRDAYVKQMLSFIDMNALKPFKIVADAGNGCAGMALSALAPHLPFDLILLNETPDGTFPNGIPNPLLPENRAITAHAVREHNADFGIGFDGDFDRCFFYDAEGNFIEGYYIVGMIASAMLAQFPQSKIIHDPRLTYNTLELVAKANGYAIESKSGHAFIKERMRKEDAIYGGEMSAHHYFRDFAYCDSGMLPWLFVAQLLSQKKVSLADLVNERIKAFPCSGEINSKVADVKEVIARIERYFTQNTAQENTVQEKTDASYEGNIAETSLQENEIVKDIAHRDGLSMEFNTWRFNVRGSNTEPVLRLNVESKNDIALMEEKRDFLLKMIRG